MRALVYGDIDLNLIDGSAIWLTSVAEVLALRPDVDVLLLQRTSLTRTIVVDDLKRHPNVRLIDPWEPATWGGQFSLEPPLGRRADAGEAAAMMAAIDARLSVDLLLIRSLETAERAERALPASHRVWVYITDPRQYTIVEARARLRTLFERVGGLLCQTDEARAVLVEAMGQGSGDRIVLLPPMIPAVLDDERPLPDAVARRLGYSGKLSPLYLLLETLDAFDRIRDTSPGAEFHVVGDKFHNVPPVADFEATVRRRLTGTPGVLWHGGLSRAAAAAVLNRVDLAASWRSPALDDSLEMSTKVLEYAALGIPVLMNPSAVQRRVFGPAYPAYVTSGAELVARWHALMDSPELYRQASATARAVARGFTFRAAAEQLAPLLTPRSRSRRSSVRVVVAGHDLKFLRPVVERLERHDKFEVMVDTYHGHSITDPASSARMLERADLVFCEWCLGNAAWYSRHLGKHQRLIVRLHLQERDLPFLDQIEWARVDRLIFIAPWVMQQCLARRPWLAPRATLIYNPIDVQDFDRPKLEGAAHNLGVIGINPRRKGPHLALDIFERLRDWDSRYTLFIKSQHPWSLAWLWQRSDERQYYEDLYARVRRSRHSNAIVFDPPGPDVPAWLATIGFVLSTSDFEGSHQAVAEAMASGAVPIIRNWEGAGELYPDRFIVDDVEAAADPIRALGRSWGAKASRAASRRELFDAGLVNQRYLELFDEVCARRSLGRQLADEGAGMTMSFAPSSRSSPLVSVGCRLDTAPGPGRGRRQRACRGHRRSRSRGVRRRVDRRHGRRHQRLRPARGTLLPPSAAGRHSSQSQQLPERGARAIHCLARRRRLRAAGRTRAAGRCRGIPSWCRVGPWRFPRDR